MFNLLKLFELCMREKKQIFIKFNTNLINSQTLEKPTRHLQVFFFHLESRRKTFHTILTEQNFFFIYKNLETFIRNVL